MKPDYKHEIEKLEARLAIGQSLTFSMLGELMLDIGKLQLEVLKELVQEGNKNETKP